MIRVLALNGDIIVSIVLQRHQNGPLSFIISIHFHTYFENADITFKRL